MATNTAGVTWRRPFESTVAELLPPWWLLLVAGIGWILVSVIVLQFNFASVDAISLLFGFVALAAGIAEIGATFIARGGWKILNAILAIAFIAAGVVAFFNPGGTFATLAVIFSFFLIFAGAFDVIQAIAARREIEAWWVQLLGGIIELVLGFWAAGAWGRSATLLVAWVAAFAIIRGVREIVTGFRIHALQDEL
jgi:uncharacterized membrane protein HdeD (DUF308 family)